MTGTDFILSLLTVSEKAATIARSCRQNDKLLSLLIQEKTELKKNTSFVADFKTLADVLIQELIRYELTKKVTKDDVYSYSALPTIDITLFTYFSFLP